MLELEFRVLKSNGDVLPASGLKLAPICGLGQTIIQNLKLYSQGVPKLQYSYYSHLYHVTHLLYHTKGFFNSLGNCSLMIPDNTDITGAGAWLANTGLIKRREIVQRSKIVQTCSRLFVPGWLSEK